MDPKEPTQTPGLEFSDDANQITRLHAVLRRYLNMEHRGLLTRLQETPGQMMNFWASDLDAEFGHFLAALHQEGLALPDEWQEKIVVFWPTCG